MPSSAAQGQEWLDGFAAGQQELETLRASEHAAWSLVLRAAPFVNAVAVMAEDKTPSLAWIADAAEAKSIREGETP